jgi:hypothetical protein
MKMLTGLRSLINSTRYCGIPTAKEKVDPKTSFPSSCVRPKTGANLRGKNANYRIDIALRGS